MSAHMLERRSTRPPTRSTGDYGYLEEVVRIGFPVHDAKTYLNRHLGNLVRYRLVEAARGESIGCIRAIDVEPHSGGDRVVVRSERTLPDGTPATYFTPEDLVETHSVVETEYGGPVPPLEPRDRIVLHVPVRSYLRFLPGIFQGAAPMARKDVVRATERSIRQWGARDEVMLTEVQEHDADQFRQFLLLFQHMMTTVTETIDQIPSITNPLQTDSSFLPWLASWVNFALDEALPMHQQRELVRRSIRLHRTRGTCLGIEEMIRVLTSAPVTLVERKRPHPAVVGAMNLSGGRNIEERYFRSEPPGHFLLQESRDPGTFFVLTLESREAFRERFGERAGPVLRRIAHIVTNEKPAHVSFTIRFDDGHPA